MISNRAYDVAVDQIELQDSTFQISTDKDLDRLAGSIEGLGLIAPPMLLRRESHYIVVSGFQRIAACRRIRIPRIPARILEEARPSLKCAQLAIAENSLQRTLNLVEISRALNLLDRFVREPSKPGKMLQILGLPESPSLNMKLKKIQHLPGPLQSGILADRISMDMALRLGGLEKNDALLLFHIFSELNLSHSKQKEVLTNIEEISRRENIPLAPLLASNGIQVILDDDGLDRLQKTKYLRDYIKKRRFPHLYAAEKQFADLLKKMKLGNRMALKPADYFEGTSLTLSISFKDLNELHQDVTTLNQELKKSNLSDLINLKNFTST